MGMSNNHFSKSLIKMALAVLLVMPGIAQAQSDPNRVFWMATSSQEASLAGRGFGRLTMANGTLTFQSPKEEWRMDLAEVKRISSSKAVANALEVERLDGQVFYVAILNAQLLMTSPGKAMQAIQRGVRNAPAPAAPERTTLVAAAGGTQQ